MKGAVPLVGMMLMLPSLLAQVASSMIKPLFTKVGGVQLVVQFSLTSLSIISDSHPLASLSLSL
jgi:hypothetical protein